MQKKRQQKNDKEERFLFSQGKDFSLCLSLSTILIQILETNNDLPRSGELLQQAFQGFHQVHAASIFVWYQLLVWRILQVDE